MKTHSVPLTSPESDVRLIVLEFTSEGEADEQFVEPSLDMHDSNHSRKSFRETVAGQEIHDDVEDEEHDYGNGVGNRSKH
jgi:hypothetical protein